MREEGEGNFDVKSNFGVFLEIKHPFRYSQLEVHGLACNVDKSAVCILCSLGRSTNGIR